MRALRALVISFAAIAAMAVAGCSGPPECPDPAAGPCGESTSTTSSSVAVSPSARTGASMAYDAVRGSIVMFGGHGAGGFLGDTWELRAGAWTKLTPATSPPSRTGAAMVYDSVRSKVVLFGGQYEGGGTGEASFLADTWEWDGVSWTERTPEASPGGRYFAAAAFDATRGAMVLFGGSDRGRSAFDETWEWDGASWTRYPAAAPSPSARADAPMVCDPGRGVCTLFGGDDGTRPTDTWQRRGTVWSELRPATSPTDRRGASMVFDGARGVAVLFGGHHGPRPPEGELLADTWEWDGSVWGLRTTATAPPARSVQAMAYDAARSVTVLFGGNGGDGPLGDTWEWDGTAWTRR